MELTQAQKDQLAGVWADPQTRDVIEKAILASIARQGVPITVGQILSVFDGLDSLIEGADEDRKDINPNR